MSKLAPVVGSALVKQLIPLIAGGEMGSNINEIVSGLSKFLESGGRVLQSDVGNVMQVGADALAKYR